MLYYIKEYININWYILFFAAITGGYLLANNEISLTYSVRISFRPEDGVLALNQECYQRLLRETLENHVRKLNVSVTGNRKNPDSVEVS